MRRSSYNPMIWECYRYTYVCVELAWHSFHIVFPSSPL